MRGQFLYSAPRLGWQRQWVQEHPGTAVLIVAGLVVAYVAWDQFRPARTRIISYVVPPEREEGTAANISEQQIARSFFREHSAEFTRIWPVGFSRHQPCVSSGLLRRICHLRKGRSGMVRGETDPAPARDAESVRTSCPSIYGTPSKDGSRHLRHLAGDDGLAAFGATAASSREASGFRCRLVAARFGPIGLSSARFTPHTRSTSGDHFQHSHPVSRLLLVREGSVLLDLAGTRTTMIAGSGAIIPGDQPSSYTATTNATCLQVDVDANETRLAPLVQSTGPALWPAGTTTLHAVGSFIITLLDADGAYLPWSDRALSQRTVEALVCALMASAPPPLTSVSPEPSIAETAMLYIRMHHRDPDLTSDTLAQALGVSTRTLQRAFAGTMNVSRRIAECRLETFLGMVRDPQFGDVSVASLSARAGYGSTETMRRSVRNATGMSVMAYRDGFVPTHVARTDCSGSIPPTGGRPVPYA